MVAIIRVSVVAALLSLLAPAAALADSFVPLPGAGKELKIKFVRYDGGTNGQMVVDVKNVGTRSTTFSAEGVYFVPKGDPEQAPQRLGAAGPFVIEGTKGARSHQSKTTLGPGQTVRVRLEVFCIDSHRASPSSSTKFAVAKKRLPVQLRQKIDAGNKQILRKNRGDVAKSKAAIQSHMWETRDEKWVPIEGERKNEKAAPTKQRRAPRNRAPRIQQQERR